MSGRIETPPQPNGTTRPHPAPGSSILFHAVCSTATPALFILDERQHCVYTNPAAEELTGYTLAELRGRALQDVVHHARPDRAPHPLEECLINQALANPILDGGGVAGTVVEVRDISAELEAAPAGPTRSG